MNCMSSANIIGEIQLKLSNKRVKNIFGKRIRTTLYKEKNVSSFQILSQCKIKFQLILESINNNKIQKISKTKINLNLN